MSHKVNTAIQKHVLVFDSGVGGLSITQAIRHQLPAVRLTLLVDNAYLPYGLLAADRLLQRVSTLIQQACDHYTPDVVVIACNSASTLVLPTLRASLKVPVVGVVPAIKPASQLSASGVIGLLATSATLERDYTDQLVSDFAQHCDVIRVRADALVNLAEAHMRGIDPPTTTLATHLQPFYRHARAAELDTVVLACTHFPLLKTQLAAAAPNVRHWVDSSAAIARRVATLLKLPTVVNGHSGGVNSALFTDLSTVNTVLYQHLKDQGLTDVCAWPTD